MNFLKELYCLCVSNNSTKIVAKASIVATNKVAPANIKTSCVAVASIDAKATFGKRSVQTLVAQTDIFAHANFSNSPRIRVISKGVIHPGIGVITYNKKVLINKGFLNLKPEKFWGPFGDFDCLQKLYPTADVFISGVMSSSGTVPIYPFIDEGVFAGSYTNFNIIANDTDYITPSSYLTSGLFRYTSKVDNLFVRPEKSVLRLRAAAPLSNVESATPPKYTLQNIVLTDPSGNTIIKYKDTIFYGDNYYTIYSIFPEDNRANLNDWHPNYPLMHGSGYNFSFDIKGEIVQDVFDENFGPGFEEYRRQPKDGLVDTVKISAFEICNSGGIGPRIENYINLHMEVDPTGHRLEKIIRPIAMPLYPKISEIWPVASSIWTTNNGLDNTTHCGIIDIVKGLRNDSVNDYSSMTSTGPINDSGRLLIKFGHEGSEVFETTRGDFGCAFDESICGMWIQPSGAFNTLTKRVSHFDDNFFAFDSVSLKVLAKKAVGSRDYALDVVGYSDDFLLNITRPSGGFLQNIEGVGILPFVSSVYPPNDPVGGTLQNINLLEPSGGDHYLLSTRPLISSTEFKWYEIPLKVFPDNLLLGASRDYSLSSLFEHLYLDIYPIPSGAQFASMQLLVRYRPQNAINITVQGGEDIGRIDKALKPVSRPSGEPIINAGSGYSPISSITNIPNAYSFNNVRSNYARRWRGVDGLSQGAFDPTQFGFDFEQELLEYPFLYSYYNFDNTDGNVVYPQQGHANATIISDLSTYKYNNIGWRLINDSIFDADLPGYSGNYRTLDWTSLASGSNNFVTNPLHGKIADAFSSAVKLHSSGSYIKVEDINISGGFAAYLRFSPGPLMSGNAYNGWNNGWLLTKYVDNTLQFGIRYSNGQLRGFCRSVNGQLVAAIDNTQYYNYIYPLSIVLTYNDDGASRLKLYTNNELSPSSNRTRWVSPASFEMLPGSGDLYIGYDPFISSGVYGFITEFGISNSGNLTQNNANLALQQTSVDAFFNGQHMHWWQPSDSHTSDSYKLWNYIDEDTQADWAIGDFKYTQFGPAFSVWSKRTGRDLISFNIKNSGIPYSAFVDKFPAAINSGVSYHTQIENDFLRFNLSNVDNNFYVTNTRITKNLPKGYKFSERAIVVETILEHLSSGEFFWEGCKETGPKLIVSLYTKTKEPYYPTTNWGLVNRSIHYLESNSSLIKLHSEFDYKNYVDQTEEWALFPKETRLTEFTEKYFSADVNDMMLQYDLVYPSGTPYHSKINIHSANVRLEDAFATINDRANELNILISGANPSFNQLNLFAESALQSSGLNLYTAGPFIYSTSGLILCMSGAFIEQSPLNLHLISYLPNSGMLNITSSGSPEIPISFLNNSLNIHTYGKDTATSVAHPYSGLSLTIFNNPIPQHLTENISLILANDPGFDVSEFAENNINLFSIGSQSFADRYAANSLNLYTFDNNPKQNLNLTIYSNPFPINDSLNLYTINYYSFYTESIDWDNYNYGWGIDVDDNDFASLPANDEIRGVNLIGYGACDSDSPAKAIDPAIITHDTVWRNAVCNDGGIFRAVKTYTGAGYSGNYYGIRKYRTLLPNAAYNVNLEIVTGSSEPINVPNEWEEWEYGTNEATNFNNVKLIADAPSGIARRANDLYGGAVAVSKDLLVVGSPQSSIFDENNVLIPLAGSIVLYKRGEDIPGTQAQWEFLDELILPSGYRRDYISATYQNMLCFPDNTNPQFCVSGQKWNIGQEGRQLGYSIDIANSGNKQVVVAGAPKASWTRQFETIVTSGVPVAMMVFTDKFTYDKKKISQIASTVNKWNILYKYFSGKWPTGFQPQIDLKLIICQLVKSTDQQNPVFVEEPWVYHTYLNRLDDRTVSNAGPSMVSGINSIFNRAFVRDTNKVDNNIPAIFGVFRDNSPSTTYGRAFASGIDSFINEYYLPYSYASGVISAVNSVPLSGYVVNISDVGQNWEVAATTLINTSLDYRNLTATNNLKYITSGVGQSFAQSNAYEFQIPPPSGGRVYIFENENNKFNLIQAINSPDEQASSDSLGSNGNNAPGIYGSTYFDMFGHDVAISDNANIISIGSPYSSKPCLVYARHESENDRMYAGIKDWLTFRGKTNTLNYYNNLLAVSGANIAAENAYYHLSQSDKFLLRSDELFWNASNRGGPINLYKEVYNYSYGDIAYTGTWRFISHKFAGTSRLGWSTDVNEDGTSVIFGAPTDSFNEYDDTNIWYDESNNTWASYVNAGAVRVFESRNYYPHNLAIEYYKFGNLDEAQHPDLAASGFYNDLSDAFNSANIPFRKTGFDEINIPQEAGLAFIITPQIDAASEEIIQRIKEWLALGDRTLVLVGNDPVWEENGLYSRSNKIINKILTGLGSRLRLHPARNEYESLQGCADVMNAKYNVVPSFVPAYAHGTSVLAGNLYAKGVGDIRIDLSKDSLQGLLINQPCDDEKNAFCELPLRHLGDLRAEWNETCLKTVGDKVIEVKYKENWPFHFGNKNPAQECDDYPESPRPLINTPNLEPRPILTAAEWLPEYSYVVPAQSGCNTVITPITSSIKVGQTYWEFGNNHIPDVKFSIFENASSIVAGDFKSLMYGDFIDPEPVVDVFETRDGLLQAVGESYYLPNDRKSRKVDDYQTIVAEYNYAASGKIVLIASQFPENSESFSSESGKDENYYLYNNIVFEDCTTPGRISQLGGWTGRTSFADIYSSSILKDTFESYGHDIIENYNANNVQSIDSLRNVIWIGNPKNKPSDIDLQKLKEWLSLDLMFDRKLVITYNANAKIAENVKYICDKLNIPMGPFYSLSDDKFLDVEIPDIQTPQSFNNNSIIVSGCKFGYNWPPLNSNISTKVTEFFAISDLEDNKFIPISGGAKLISYNVPLYETYFVNPDQFWKIDAKSEIEFATSPGSGYRLFVNWVREAQSEKYGITTYIEGATKDASPDAEPSTVPINDYGVIGGVAPDFEGAGGISSTYTEFVDFKAPIDHIKIKFETTQHNKIPDSGFLPKTPRILSISGCFLPIEEKFSVSEQTIIIGYKVECEPWYNPEYTVTVPATFRPILTDSSKYCPTGCTKQTGRPIQDGPIVMAEEYENFSGFNNGLERSRIIVLSDSTMIQGQCSAYRDTSFWYSFVQSLYPNSPQGLPGQQFSFVQKLIAPERGSPGKYYAVSGIPGLATNFGNGIYGNTFRYTSNENNYNPATLTRAADPLTVEERDKEIKIFEEQKIPLYSVFPRLSGVFIDPAVGGGTPDRVKAGLTDLIYGQQNYAGDLFGFSVSIHNDQILVGAKNHGFAKETIAAWNLPINSGDFDLNNNGGAGAVFTFQKTYQRINGYNQTVPWEFKQKIRPSSLKLDDEFGASITMDGDFVAIGAPGHDYKTTHQHIYSGSAAFIRKDFTNAFDIPQHIFDNYATEYQQDIGAVFTYQNKLTDWQNRSKSWVLAERINASGYESPKSNDAFGLSVSIDRVRRGDADYTLVVGAPQHNYPSSGNHYTGVLNNAGAAFVYDAMLREQASVIPNSQSWLDAKVFGAQNNDNLKIRVYQNASGDPLSYNVQGLVFTNNDGELYLEASGFDPAPRGFITHRPRVSSVTATLENGTNSNASLGLLISGAAPIENKQINLSIIGPDKDIVYNNMNLYTTSWYEGSGWPPLNFVTVGASGVSFSGGMNIVTSGIGSLETTIPLNLRIRGK